jgi:hypothetical protein
MKNTVAITTTINAEQGTSTTVANAKPPRQQATETSTERSIIEENLRAKVSAVSWGNDISDMSNIMPTKRMVSTIQSATSTVIAVLINLTGRRLTRA